MNGCVRSRVTEPEHDWSALRLLLVCLPTPVSGSCSHFLSGFNFVFTGSNLHCRMDEPLPPSVGDGVARHELKLRSCYAEVLGSEPGYTSCHDAFW
jgi:hypothetical protein